MATAKHPIDLVRRQAKVTNLNDSPEKSGDSLVPRMDVSLEILLEKENFGPVLRTRDRAPIALLWTEAGEKQLRDVGKFAVNLEFNGTATFETTDGDESFSADGAVLKKMVLKPLMGKEAGLTCQIRIDPSEHREILGRMRLDQECVVSFKGDGEETGDTQGELV